MVMKENEDDLTLFLDLLQVREKETNATNLIQNIDEIDGSIPAISPLSKILSSMPARKSATEEFLNLEIEKSDYDWLLALPCTPLLLSPEMDMEENMKCEIGMPDIDLIALTPQLQIVNSPLQEPISKKKLTSKKASSATALPASNAGNRRSSSVGRASTICRASALTSQSTLPSKPKPSRASTPTFRPTFPSSTKATVIQVGSSAARSSTPNARFSIPASKSASKTDTIPPPRISSAPSKRSSSVKKSDPMAKNTVSSIGVPSNSRASMAQRSSSASKGRPIAPVETKGKSRQQCSPLRGQAKHRSAHSNSNDHVSPVLIGTQMVKRVTNMRKLAPPNQDDRHGNSVGKPSLSRDSLGFGRTLSKNSLDMAIRHMDIRRTISGNLRPIVTSIPASSINDVKSKDSKSITNSVSDSPLATSSNTSSEPSAIIYDSNSLYDCIASDKDISSFTCQQGR